jgi:hypothetical protein
MDQVEKFLHLLQLSCTNNQLPHHEVSNDLYAMSFLFLFLW